MNKPVWVTDKYGDTEDIVKGWGLEILAEKRFGGYQGDHAFLLRNHDGQIGLSVIGYGSCTGCDYLQDLCYEAQVTGDWIKVVELSKERLAEVHWENSMKELMAWVDEVSQVGSHWWTYDTEAMEWLNSHGAHLELPLH